VIRLRQQHWMIAFSLAFATHFVAFLYSISLPGSEPVYRGGGIFDLDDKPSPGANGIFVLLGNSGNSSGEEPGRAALKEQAPAQRTRETLAQSFVAGEGKPGSDAEKTEQPEPPKPTDKPVSEQTMSTPTKEVEPATKKVEQAKKPETIIAAAPTSKRKPKPPALMPELETLGRRLSVQGPPEMTQPAAQAKTPRADAERQGAKTDGGKPKKQENTASGLAFVSQGSRVGTASGSRTGEVRELNYEDQVMLWLRRHGAYPREAAMYNLVGTVTVKFAINRQGKILYHFLVKKSEWYLLNRAVKRMMERSSPVPPIPPEIASDELTFTFPVEFDPRHLR
jgi:TonB family protein